MTEPSRHGPSTRAVHAGEEADPATGAAAVPIYETAPFSFATAKELEETFYDQREGKYIYSRLGNPTVRALEKKVAALEGAEDAAAFGSGMAAISTVMSALLRPGSRLVSYRDVYGGTSGFFQRVLEPWGVEVAWLDVGDETAEGGRALREAMERGADVLYLESPTNPTLKVADIAAAARMGREAGATVVVDNTFASPILQLPLEMGAHLAVHSLTKFLGGHGDTTGGLAAGDAGIMERVRTHRVDLGGVMDPLAAFLIMRGVKTAKVRVMQASENALAAARYLEDHPRVRKVNYPGLASNEWHETARRQMRAFGGMLSFEVDAEIEGVRAVADSFELVRIIPSLGSVETTLLLPAVSSHYKLSREEREAIGIPDGLIRLSVGIEEVEDIIEDLSRGLGVL
ncbi:MAG: aminotransferase class I/II-fold pyridoxal phosphate-dependent enzyme [bacterium]